MPDAEYFKGSRLSTVHIGKYGEEAAKGYLQHRRYKIVENNYRCPVGEVDIIARDGDILVFVEVRARKSEEYGAPEESLSKRKRERLVTTALTYLQDHPCPPGGWRIDLICVKLGQGREKPQVVQHIENAIERE